MEAKVFIDGLAQLGVDFYTGVPDSLLKPLNDVLYTTFGLNGAHVVAANEGGAVGLAAGHYIATGKPALVYLQNSGIGNAINPIASLLNDRVYGIPCVFVVGWRGQPGVHDEPQHAFQGLVTKDMLTLCDLTVFEMTADTDAAAYDAMLEKCAPLLAAGKSVAFLVHQGGLTGEKAASFAGASTMTRESALNTLLHDAGRSDVFVVTTGKASREVFELREALGQSHGNDFLTVGSMGHANMVALGIAKAKPATTVWCLDGDGAMLMHLGGLVVEAQQRATNMIHVLLNNGVHESVGGMPVAGGDVQFAPLAQAVGFEAVYRADTEEQLQTLLPEIRQVSRDKRCFLEIMVRQGSRADLGRPTQTPQENLHALMATLRK